MSSRDPDRLRQELESIDFPGDVDLLTDLTSEARETVDAQKETLTDVDTKASRILRLNVLLIGVIVSVLSFLAQNGDTRATTLPGVDNLLNPYTELGVAALILSTASAALTYTTSELDVGLSHENLTNLLRARFTQEEARELLLKNYVVRINFNRSTNIRNIPLITSTIVLLVAGVMLLTLGVYEALVTPVPLWLLALSGLLFVLVVWISGLLTQTLRALWDLWVWR